MKWSDLSQQHLSQMNQLLQGLRTHDEDTFWHCHRVAEMATALARQAGLDPYEQLMAQVGGLLHDLGKAKIPSALLNKPGKLTEEEYLLMQQHAFFSAQMIEPLATDGFFREVQEVVLHHHEWVDGGGYPFGLKDFEVPYVSKVILIVDTVDAMSVRRAYRSGLPREVVYRELEKFSGSQFDSQLAQLFIKMGQRAGTKSGWGKPCAPPPSCTPSARLK